MEEYFDNAFMAKICKRAGEVVTKKEIFEYYYKAVPLLRESLKKLVDKEK